MKFNLLFFVRILLRNLGLLILAPVTLATLVFFLTREEPKVYESKGRVYTAFATGSSIELSDTRLNFRATNIAFDNLLNLIKSKNTMETVGLRLFTQHMMLDSADRRYIGPEKYRILMESVPQEVKELVVPGEPEVTYTRFDSYRRRDNQNFVHRLLSLNHPDYSYNKILEKISVRRISSSDFLDIGYTSEDPGICQNTLQILINTFIAENAEVKANQSDAVVAYFERQLTETSERLNQAEQELLQFNQRHLLMNYYEQTKQIAARRENFEGQFQGVRQANISSKAIIEQLETKLGAREVRKLKNEEVLALRERIADLHYRISMESIQVDLDSLPAQEESENLKDLMVQLDEQEQRLNQVVQELFVLDHDKDGINQTDILKDWLEETLRYEGSKAELKMLEEKRIEFDDLARKYAPLGATMKKLERKINIEEQEYLSLVHSLGLAKLRQQNSELKADLQVLDAPYFPLNPQPSKRLILVIAAGLVGFIMVTATIFVLEFLDGNINTARRAEEKTGLKVSSIFPTIKLNNTKIDYPFLLNKAVNAISRNTLLNQFRMKEQEGPMVNMLFSTQQGEGKTYICSHLIDKLCELGYCVLHITYDPEEIVSNQPCYQRLIYPINDNLYKINTIQEFDAQGIVGDFMAFDFVVLELPGIIRNPFPVKLASVMDFTYLVVRANRPWTEADQKALDLFNEATTGPEPTIILNGVKVLEMEGIIGELPKKRGPVRRFVKRLIQFRFYNQKNIA